MTPRRLLVIGSQCLDRNHLAFLPDVALRLHALLLDPGPGGCVGIPLGDRPPGLLIDPSVVEAKAAIRGAIEEAASAGATLILAYIGHGESPDERSGDFYLMPTDSTEPTSDGAIHFAEFLKDRIKRAGGLAGLVVLLDACHAGAGAWQSMERWAQSLRGDLAFELLTATDDRATANAPLARALIDLLERGAPEFPGRIHCRDVHRRLVEQHRPPQHVAYNADDDRLSIARNLARDPGDVFWQDSPGRAQILKQTEYFEPTPGLAALVEAGRSHPVLVVTGEAGAGKSSLASAMARPELTGGLVPVNFIRAIALLGQTTNQRGLADDLERQLRRSLPGFAEAVAEFERSVILPVRETLDFLAKKVLGPLKYLPGAPEVRIVLDAFDQLPDGTRSAIARAMGDRPAHLRLIITARADTPGCPPGHAFHLGRADGAILDRYLTARRVPEAARAAVLDRARDHWLVARLLADAVLADPDIDLANLPGTVNAAYTTLLDQSGAVDSWPARFRPLLGPLAVAGPGPILPLRLLAYAVEALGGVAGEAEVRSVLVALRGLVVRSGESTPDEQVGTFHPTLNEYLLSPSAASAGYAIDALESHRAMIAAIAALAPSDEHRRDDSLHRYAFLREADHLWAIGEVDAIIARLPHRESNDPRENLARWREWLARFRLRWDDLHPTILDMRGRVASWTGQSGDMGEALRLSRALLADLERVLGRADPNTLTTRGNIATWISRSGDAAGALGLFSALLPDLERALGPDALDTLTARSNIAACTGGAGDAAKALQLSRALLPDRERVLGPDHPDTLTTRNNIASWTGESGDAVGAFRLFSALLPDRERVMGRDHPDTLATRGNIATWIGESGDAAGALGLFSALLPDRERVLGPDHPDTLTTRNNIACWTGSAGDAPEALRLSIALLPDLERTLGRDHPYSLATRGNIASSTGESGDAAGALGLFSALLPDRERVLGRNHPDTLKNRSNIATWTGHSGDLAGALRLSLLLLPDQERVLGPDHPDPLTTRNNVANLIGRAGDAREALSLSLALLPDRERVLGPDHPDTLATRSNIASWTGHSGDLGDALRLFSALLPDQERVLGPEHPDTLATLASLAFWAIGTGDLPEGCRQLREGLSRAGARFGPDHPRTLFFSESLRVADSDDPPADVTPGPG